MKENKKDFSALFLCLTVAFSVCLIVANLIEIKTVGLPGGFTITAGFVVFPISYIINDCIVEVYGFRKARLAIWIGFASALFVSVMLQLAIALPGSGEWTAQDAMERIYGTVPRIMGASFAAFLCGSMVNAYVMSKMKAADASGSRFSLRAIVSTLFGEGVDSLIFFPIAFLGTLPLGTVVSLIITQMLLKTLYEIVALPATVRVVKRLKAIEDSNISDNGISYKWWKIKEY